MNADGTQPTRVTTNSAYHSYDFPAWSPDGAQIAFQANSVPNPGTYVMNADGSGVTQLADGSYYNRPVWFGQSASPLRPLTPMRIKAPTAAKP
jgi:Tol biopolymer transport system component